MGLVILKKDREQSKSYEEAEELARRRYLKNRNHRLYKNLRRFLNNARKASTIQDYDEEYTQLHATQYGILRRMGELEAKGITSKYIRGMK